MKGLVRDGYHFIHMLRAGDLDVNVPLFLAKSVYYHLLSKNIFARHNTTILGIRNIETRGQLSVGTSNIAFLNHHDRTFLNIRGKLVIDGRVGIGKGCRIDVNEGAVCTLRECWINGQTNLIVAHGVEVGKGSSIAWGCELLDEDFHTIEYEGRRQKEQGIVIGDHVWVGSHVKILKGVHIGDNSVIAANAVVTKSFAEKGVLIAGNPAKVIKRGVDWH